MKEPADLARQLIRKARDVEYPFTHELRELIELALPYYPVLENYRETIPEYTEFAVRLRYDDLPWISREEAAEALRETGRLLDELLPLIQ